VCFCNRLIGYFTKRWNRAFCSTSDFSKIYHSAHDNLEFQVEIIRQKTTHEVIHLSFERVIDNVWEQCLLVLLGLRNFIHLHLFCHIDSLLIISGLLNIAFETKRSNWINLPTKSDCFHCCFPYALNDIFLFYFFGSHHILKCEWCWLQRIWIVMFSISHIFVKRLVKFI
jgi:hypothetical protein